MEAKMAKCEAYTKVPSQIVLKFVQKENFT